MILKQILIGILRRACRRTGLREKNKKNKKRAEESEDIRGGTRINLFDKFGVPIGMHL